eukprot:1935439-Pyramimonas_sp.AAC.2
MAPRQNTHLKGPTAVKPQVSQFPAKNATLLGLGLIQVATSLSSQTGVLVMQSDASVTTV